jgi:outer membrane protein assembly factor BamB
MMSLEPDGTPRWSLGQTLQDNGWMRSSPAVNADGTLYLVSPSNVLYAIRPDGSAEWNVSLGLPGSPATGGTPSSPLLSPDGTIYVGLGREVVAVESNGRLRWRTSLSPGGSEIVSSPALALDGRVLIGSSDGALYALDPVTGDRTLLQQTFGGVDATPLVDPATGAITFGSEDGAIYVLDAQGHLIGKAKTNGPVFASAALGANGQVYAPSSDGNLYALKGAEIAWIYTPSSLIEQPVSVDSLGRIYAVTREGELFSLTAAGKPLWTIPLPAPATAAPIIGGRSLLYVSVKDHGLLALGNDGTSSVIGDLNGDGALNLGDVTLALQIAIGTLQPTPDQLQAADVAPRVGTGGRAYGDGKVTVPDVSRLLRRYLGLEPDPWP